MSSTLDIPSLNSIPDQLLGEDTSNNREGEEDDNSVPGVTVPPCETRQNSNSCRDEVAEFSERVADFRRRVENGGKYQTDSTM